MFRGSPPNECVKDGRKLSTATLSLLPVELNGDLQIDSTDGARYVRRLSVCHARDAMPTRFHIEMPSAPYNIATLDAHFLCG